MLFVQKTEKASSLPLTTSSGGKSISRKSSRQRGIRPTCPWKWASESKTIRTACSLHSSAILRQFSTEADRARKVVSLISTILPLRPKAGSRIHNRTGRPGCPNAR